MNERSGSESKKVDKIRLHVERLDVELECEVGAFQRYGDLQFIWICSASSEEHHTGRSLSKPMQMTSERY